MRFILFETYKFPEATISAKLDMNALRGVMNGPRVEYPLKLNVNLHGIEKSIETSVTVSRISPVSVSVANIKPIVVPADAFGFTAGIAKLSEAVGGIPIANAATFTFDLVFETGDKISEIKAAETAAEKRKIQVETAPISADACETRFNVISTTRAIYFRTGSAELDPESTPMLNSIADIASRCPAVKIEVSGHTDAVGHNVQETLPGLKERVALGVLALDHLEAERGEGVRDGLGVRDRFRELQIGAEILVFVDADHKSHALGVGWRGGQQQPGQHDAHTHHQSSRTASRSLAPHLRPARSTTIS